MSLVLLRLSRVSYRERVCVKLSFLIICGRYTFHPTNNPFSTKNMRSRLFCVLAIIGISFVLIAAVNIALYLIFSSTVSSRYNGDDCYVISNSSFFEITSPDLCTLKVGDIEYPYFIKCGEYPPFFECKFYCRNPCFSEDYVCNCRLYTKEEYIQSQKRAWLYVCIFFFLLCFCCSIFIIGPSATTN